MKIEVGKVLKAQGIRGEVKVACYLDDSQMLKSVKQMYLGNELFSVQKFRADGKFFYVLLEGIADRNSAEGYRNYTVYCQKEDVLLQKGRYFVSDIVGCRVVLDDGQTVGTISEVLQYGAADVYVCQNVSFPALNDLIVCVDVVAKKIVLSAKRFEQVAVFDED